jgi:hypothetical protein
MIDFYVLLYRGIVSVAELLGEPDCIEDLTWAVSDLLLNGFGIVCIAKILAKAKRKPLTVLVPFKAELTMVGLAEFPKYWAIVPIMLPLVSVCIAVFGSGDDLGFPWARLLLGVWALVWVIRLAHRFGKETGFIIGLLCLGPIFFPILAFGDAEYKPTYKRGRSGEADGSA